MLSKKIVGSQQQDVDQVLPIRTSDLKLVVSGSPFTGRTATHDPHHVNESVILIPGHPIPELRVRT